jgi:NhaP-type Na+/H+ or K+/H+ antiporter
MASVHAVWSSALIFMSSVVVGIAVALLYALMTKHIRPPEAAVFQAIMVILFGYLSYLLAEISGASGVISIFFRGIGMSHYAVNNIGDTEVVSIKVRHTSHFPSD